MQKIIDDTFDIGTIESLLFGRSLQDLKKVLVYYQRLERAWNLIESSYADPSISLEKAADISGISKNHLNVLLHRVTTFTFHQLLTRYRVLKAILILSHQNHSVLRVAMDSGFGTVNSFERDFRLLTGLTPTELKRLYRFGRLAV